MRDQRCCLAQLRCVPAACSAWRRICPCRCRPHACFGWSHGSCGWHGRCWRPYQLALMPFPRLLPPSTANLEAEEALTAKLYEVGLNFLVGRLVRCVAVGGVVCCVRGLRAAGGVLPWPVAVRCAAPREMSRVPADPCCRWPPS